MNDFSHLRIALKNVGAAVKVFSLLLVSAKNEVFMDARRKNKNQRLFCMHSTNIIFLFSQVCMQYGLQLMVICHDRFAALKDVSAAVKLFSLLLVSVTNTLFSPARRKNKNPSGHSACILIT
jgi:hypothetical protein